MPCSGPPGAASASTRRSIVGSSIRGGAWCGLILASMTRGPVQPQCFWWMNSPIPQMSAAGSERVKVTHKKVSLASRGEFAVVHDDDQWKTLDRVVAAKEAKKDEDVMGIGFQAVSRPLDGQDAGQHRGGCVKPSGKRRPGGHSVGNVASHRSRGRDHNLRPLVQAMS